MTSSLFISLGSFASIIRFVFALFVFAFLFVSKSTCFSRSSDQAVFSAASRASIPASFLFSRASYSSLCFCSCNLNLASSIVGLNDISESLRGLRGGDDGKEEGVVVFVAVADVEENTCKDDRALDRMASVIFDSVVCSVLNGSGCPPIIPFGLNFSKKFSESSQEFRDIPEVSIPGGGMEGGGL